MQNIIGMCDIVSVNDNCRVFFFGGSESIIALWLYAFLSKNHTFFINSFSKESFLATTLRSNPHSGKSTKT